MGKSLDDVLPAQFGNRPSVESKLPGENFLAVLAERRRWTPHGASGVGELERNPEHLQGAGRRMLDGFDHLARGRLRVIERFGDRVDLPAGDPRGLELG